MFFDTASRGLQGPETYPGIPESFQIRQRLRCILQKHDNDGLVGKIPIPEGLLQCTPPVFQLSLKGVKQTPGKLPLD